ncbi:MAG: hypothetical protein JNK65_08310, partial [Deltaproteobacteria bacterium]|nr:hypothetical protein [Deltaproteobacteria bacterium]
EYDDIEEYNADNHPPLIDSCIRLIDDISPKFKAQECNFEYPNEILIFRLLNELIKFAGSKTDLHLRFIEIIANFFSRRRLFAEHYDGKNAKEIKEESIKKEVKEIFEKEFSIVWPKGSVGSENQEGGVVK